MLDVTYLSRFNNCSYKQLIHIALYDHMRQGFAHQRLKFHYFERCYYVQLTL